MNLPLSAAVAVVAILSTSFPSTSATVDPDCLKSLEAASAQARKRIAIYQGELNNLKENPNSSGALSICGSALSRAERYFKKNKNTDSLCTAGSTYIDGQVLQLFKNATITCHSEITSILDRMPRDQQAPIAERIRQKEAESR
jgi:hypothetical protein